MQLLVLAAIIGAPVSALAYGFLKVVDELQTAFFTSIPKDLGFDSVPAWWPLPLLVVAGVLVALAIQRLPGIGGHSPADGFHAGGRHGADRAARHPARLPRDAELRRRPRPRGPAHPHGQRARGAGGAPRRARRPAHRNDGHRGGRQLRRHRRAVRLTAAERVPDAGGGGHRGADARARPAPRAAGRGHRRARLRRPRLADGVRDVLARDPESPRLRAAHRRDVPVGHRLRRRRRVPGARHPVARAGGPAPRGAPDGPAHARPRGADRRAGHRLRKATDKSSSEVLFSGQSALPGLVGQSAEWSVGALLLLVLCKSLAYALSLSSFRGGPVFPALFIGAAAGMAAADLPGLSLVPAVAMGIGAMCAAMLGLPLTSTLLATVLLGTDGLNVMPLVIVAVVVAHVTSARLRRHRRPRNRRSPRRPRRASAIRRPPRCGQPSSGCRVSGSCLR